MKRRAILLAAVLAMLALVAAAVAWDCVRIAAGHRANIRLADEELAKHEARLVALLRGSPQKSPEVEGAIVAYEAAAESPDPKLRLAAYDEIVTAFQKTMPSKIDPTNPLDRKFMDDIAGAINRRDVARDPFDVEVSDYQQYLRSFRGRVARWCSKQAAADYVVLGD